LNYKINKKKIKLIFETSPNENFYYGYYTHSPLSSDNNFLLAHKISFKARNLNKNDSTEVGYFNLKKKEWIPIGNTQAFNWQQGSLLQWLGPDYQSKIIYNIRKDNKFQSRIINLKNGSSRIIPHPIYEIHPDGETALSFCFERQYFCRAYHYEGVINQKWNVPIHPEDGIIKVNLNSGKYELLLPTSKIASINPTSTSENNNHWLEHLLLNPSGTRLAFLHRFGKGDEFTTRLFTADLDGQNLYCLPGYSTQSYSHMAWRNNESYAIFSKEEKEFGKTYSSLTRSDNIFKKMLVKTYRTVKQFIPRDFTSRQVATTGYSLCQDGSSQSTLLSKGMLREDGHPSWTIDGRFMLTDTYADDNGYRHLVMYDNTKNIVHHLGSFFSPINNTGYRCDLHPRFSNDNKYIIIDTAHNTNRQMLVFKIEWKRSFNYSKI
jgi:hypothetical protein